jgi:hypothetical protein
MVERLGGLTFGSFETRGIKYLDEEDSSSA